MTADLPGFTSPAQAREIVDRLEEKIGQALQIADGGCGPDDDPEAEVPAGIEPPD